MFTSNDIEFTRENYLDGSTVVKATFKHTEFRRLISEEKESEPFPISEAEDFLKHKMFTKAYGDLALCLSKINQHAHYIDDERLTFLIEEMRSEMGKGWA